MKYIFCPYQGAAPVHPWHLDAYFRKYQCTIKVAGLHKKAYFVLWFIVLCSRPVRETILNDLLV